MGARQKIPKEETSSRKVYSTTWKICGLLCYPKRSGHRL